MSEPRVQTASGIGTYPPGYPPKRILLATDGSEDAALASRAAVDLAIGAGSELHVAHFWQNVPTTRFEAFVRSQFLEEAKELLAAHTALLGKAGAEVTGTYLREGPAVDGVLDLAGEIGADLVVMGSRGLGPWAREARQRLDQGPKGGEGTGAYLPQPSC